MNKSLYPHSTRDRFVFWSSIFCVLLSAYSWLVLDFIYTPIASIIGALVLFSLSYFLRDNKEVASSSDEYAKVITQVSSMIDQLNKLNKFFMHEQQRIKDTEATIQKLHDERTELEPIVQTQRETVEAILSAHANRTVRSVWKERLIGFVSGIFTSILASMIYDFILR